MPPEPAAPSYQHPSKDFTYARVLRRVNPIIRALLRSPLHGALSGRLLLLDFCGRRSGNEFSIPLAYAVIDGEIIVLISKPATRSWWRNFREPWPATVRIRGRKQRVQGRWVEPGSPDFRNCFEKTFRRFADTTKIYEVEFDTEHGLTEAQLETLSSERGAVVFTPAPETGMI